MLPLFEGYLEPTGRSGRDERRYDLVREGVVVLLGTLAGHMDQGDDKVGDGRGVGVCMAMWNGGWLTDAASLTVTWVSKVHTDTHPQWFQQIVGDQQLQDTD
jgi:hypothetical protein